MSRLSLTAKSFEQARLIFDTYERLVFLEFRSLNGSEVHEAAFSRILKANPYAVFQVPNTAPNRDVIMLGTDQRDYFVPLVREEAQRLSDGDPVFDIGCGDGQTTARAFENIQCKPVANILDPTEAYIAEYEKLIDTGMVPLRKGQSFVEGIDALMDRSTEDDTVQSLLNSHALCLALHSLYFSADTTRFLNFVLDCLRIGGRAIVVFADEKSGFSGTLARLYYEARDQAAGDDRRRKIERRFELFGIGDEPITARQSTAALRKGLKRSDFQVLAANRHESRMYGNDLGDILALGFIADLGEIEHTPHDQRIAFVSETLFRNPERFDLALETDGIRTNMLSVLQPQYYFCIEKTDVGD